MTSSEAKNAILLHAGFRVSDERLGLTGRLRPYQGLDEADFAEIAHAIVLLHSELADSLVIEKEVVAALWWICDRSRILALNPTSSISQNKLASEQELTLLASWVEVIESMSNGLLQGIDLPMCIFRLLEYISFKRCVKKANFRDLSATIEECIGYDDADVAATARLALQELSE